MVDGLTAVGSGTGTATPLTLGAYAKRRGCSKNAVSKAIKSGRLKLSVVFNASGQPKIADAHLADREWTQNTDQSRTTTKTAGAVQASAATPPPTLTPSTTAAQQRLRDETPAERQPRKPGDPAPQLDPDARWSVVDATAEQLKWKALLAEAKYKQELGELVSAKDVEIVQAGLFTIIRTKLLAVPGKARSNAPHLTLVDVALIDRLIRETLEELAAVEPPAPPDEPEGAAGADAASGAAA